MFGHYESNQRKSRSNISTLHAGCVPFSDLHRVEAHPYCGAFDDIWMALDISHNDKRLFVLALFRQQSDNICEARIREHKKTWIWSLG